MRLERKHFVAIWLTVFGLLAHSAGALAQAVADPRVADLVQAGKVRIGVFPLSNIQKRLPDNRRVLPLEFHVHFRRVSDSVRS